MKLLIEVFKFVNQTINKNKKQDNPCSKHAQPLEQTALPLQLQIRSCKKSDDI
jgi:hypothetical protein